jgi:Antibiotic biosynthesis monooxygenase
MYGPQTSEDRRQRAAPWGGWDPSTGPTWRQFRENDPQTQIVQFGVEPAQRDELIAAIVGEVERWVRRRPGFISSTLHAGHDGRNFVKDAQWDEASFKGFTKDPERRTAARRHPCSRSVVEAARPSLQDRAHMPARADAYAARGRPAH